MNSANLLRELGASEDEPSIPNDEVPWDRLYKMSEEEFDEFAKRRASKMVTIRITESTRRKLRRSKGKGETWDQVIRGLIENAEDFIALLLDIAEKKSIPLEDAVCECIRMPKLVVPSKGGAGDMATIRIRRSTKRSLQRFKGKEETYDRAIQNIIELSKCFVAELERRIKESEKFVPLEEAMREIEAKRRKKGRQR